MAKRMSSQTKLMVEAINDYLRMNHVKDMRDSRFADMGWLLLKADCYQGFNYFTVDGRLSGGPTEEFDHLEYYIK